jgi:hypothetical protein
MRRIFPDLAAPLGALAAALVACVWVLILHRESPRTLVSAHGLLHAAIAERFQSGVGAGFPPENPYFAGEPLPYYWCFQWAGAKLSAILGTDPLHAFEAMIVASLFVLVLASAALGRSLYRSGAAGLALPGLLLAGALPQGALLLLARLPAWGIPSDDGGYLWGVVHPVARMMRVWDEFSMYGPLFSFFVSATTRPLGLAALVILLLALQRFLARPSAGRGAAVAASATILGCASALLALTTGATLVAGLSILALLHGVFRRPAFLAVAAIAAGLLASLPTWSHLIGTAPLALHDPPSVLRQVGRMAESGWLLVMLACLGLRSVSADGRSFVLALCTAALLLVIGCALLSLPVGNEDNLFHGALVMLAVPAAGCVLSRRPAAGTFTFNPRRAAFLAAAFLPTFAVQAAATTGRPPVDLSLVGGRIERANPAGPEARLYRWIEARTDPRAVFVIDPRPPIQAACGNSAELPALTGRALFTERTGHYLVDPEPDGKRRPGIAARLATGEPMPREDSALLSKLSREVYVVSREPGGEAALERLYGLALFRADPLSVFRWRPQ